MPTMIKTSHLSCSLSLGLLIAACGGDIALLERPEVEGDTSGECSDGVDNDADTLFDCQDPDCSGAPECIPNNLPTIPEIEIQPANPSSNDDLTCVFLVPSADADNDTITYTYRWLRGTDPADSTEAILPRAETTKGQTWTCEVTPHDSIGAGVAGIASVTIRNSPPGAPEVVITPGTPLDSDALSCTIASESYDADGDSVQYRYEWFRNGTDANNTLDYIDAEGTLNGETWLCQVTPRDDEEDGEPGEDSVTIHIDHIAQAAVGEFHTCILFSTSPAAGIRCSGSNSDGQTEANESEQFQWLTSGRDHSCAIKQDASVACWGSEVYENNDSFTSIAAGEDATCAITTQQEIECWGNCGSWGQPPSGQNFKQVTLGADFGCALNSTGYVDCWGNVPDDSEGKSNGLFDSISAGGAHVCGITINESVECWGDDSSSQVSDKPTSGSFVSVSAGKSHTCGVRFGGHVLCWGDNSAGQSDPPTGYLFSLVDSGWTHSCGILAEESVEGTPICWGCGNSSDQGQCTPPN